MSENRERCPCHVGDLVVVVSAAGGQSVGVRTPAANARGPLPGEGVFGRVAGGEPAVLAELGKLRAATTSRSRSTRRVGKAAVSQSGHRDESGPVIEREVTADGFGDRTGGMVREVQACLAAVGAVEPSSTDSDGRGGGPVGCVRGEAVAMDPENPGPRWHPDNDGLSWAGRRGRARRHRWSRVAEQRVDQLSPATWRYHRP